MCDNIDIPTCLYDTIDCTGDCCEEGRLMYERYIADKVEKETRDEYDNETE